MGYEIKAYIGETSPYTSSMDMGSKWFEVHAIMDLCRFGDTELMKLIKRKEKKNGKKKRVYLYSGEDRVDEDCYGMPLFVITPDEVLKATKKDLDRDYRRIKIFHELVESFKKNFGTEFEIVFFGH